MARKKSLSIVYNGVEVWQQLDLYIEKFTYTDAVDASDEISFSVIDRDLKWVNAWLPVKGDVVFAVEYLPGQFDQRADSAAQCIQIISKKDRPVVKTAKELL